MFKTTAMWIWAMSDVMRSYHQSREKLTKQTNKKLQRVLIAAQGTSYYQKIMREQNYNPAFDFRGPQDLEFFPILTKDIIKEHGIKAFTPENVDLSGEFSDSTSGSTGLPLKIYRDPQARALQLAKWMRVLFVNGYSVFDKTLSFTGPDRLTEGRSVLQTFGLLRRYPINFLLQQDEMVNAMVAYQPNVVYGNRSSLDLVSEELQRFGITYPLKLLIGGAEIIEEEHRKLYEKCFETRLVESYGTVELGVLAFDTPNRDGMSLCEDQSYFEFIDESAKTVAPGEMSRIIVTDLANTLMPFIRYDQGDKVIHQLANEKDKNGWRRLSKIIGRDNDIVLLPDGRRLQGHFFYKLLSSYNGVNRFRVIQKSVNYFEIYLQTDSDYLDSIEDDLKKNLKENISVDCEFTVIQVDQLDLDKNGKFRLLISEVQ